MKVKYIRLSHKEAAWIIHILSEGRVFFFDAYARSICRLLSSKFPPGIYDDDGNLIKLVTTEKVNQQNKRHNQKVNPQKK